MKEINMVLGDRVRDRRAICHITREKLAEIIDVSPRFLAEVEGGKTGVSLSTLKSLCLALDTTADYLIGLTDNTEAESSDKLMGRIGQIDSKFYPAIISLIDNLKDL